MDIYCSTCAEPYELYIGDDEDRAVIDSVRRGECPACNGVKPATCHDCGGTNEVATDCSTCPGKLICLDCWGEHDYGTHDRPRYESNKLSRAQASAVLYDVMGDDLDGVASMMDDAEYMGWIE